MYPRSSMKKRWAIWVAVASATAGCGGTRLVGAVAGSPGSGGVPDTGAGGGVSDTCVNGGAGAVSRTCKLLLGSDVPDGGHQSCNQLTADYEAALNAALYCTPGAPSQCQAYAITAAVCNDSAPCPYVQAVNDSTGTLASYERWSAQCGGICTSASTRCNGPPAPQSVCVAVDGGGSTGGICVPRTRQNPSSGTGGGFGLDGGADGALNVAESCDQLAAQYAVAVNAAMACTPGAPDQCQARINTMPDPCALCPPRQPANDATAVSALQLRWAAQCAVNVRCSGSGCGVPPPPGHCVAVPGGGICVDTSPDGGT
jgi:hypothetical protein